MDQVFDLECNWLPFYRPFSFASQPFDCFAYEFDQVPGEWKDLGFHAVHSLDLAYMFGERVNEDRFYNGGPWEQQFFFWGAGDTLDQFEDFTEPVMDERRTSSGRPGQLRTRIISI